MKRTRFKSLFTSFSTRNEQPVVKGFTLIELLVVIAIISLLVSILLPSLQKAKELAIATSCAVQLRSLGLGIAQYMSDFDGYYPPTYYDYHWDEPPPGTKWFNTLYPYMGSYKAFNCPKLNQICPDTEVQDVSQWGVAGQATLGFISNYRYNMRNFGTHDPSTRQPYSEVTSQQLYSAAGRDFFRGIVVMCGLEFLSTNDPSGVYQYLYHPTAYPHDLQDSNGSSNVLFPDLHVELTPYNNVTYCWYPSGGYPYLVFYVEP